MFRANMITNLPRAASRVAARTTAASRATRAVTTLTGGRLSIVVRFSPSGSRSISTTTPRKISILPDGAKEPANKADKPADAASTTVTPTEITEAQYHQLADEYLEAILIKFEELQDAREDVDVEYSAGVMTINFGPNIGTYVINKQPPNKQIWLSSPKSGPKRFDWVVTGEGQNDKQGTARGDWIYVRDGSDSTLARLFKDELGVDLGLPVRRFGD